MAANIKTNYWVVFEIFDYSTLPEIVTLSQLSKDMRAKVLASPFLALQDVTLDITLFKKFGVFLSYMHWISAMPKFPFRSVTLMLNKVDVVDYEESFTLLFKNLESAVRRLAERCENTKSLDVVFIRNSRYSKNEKLALIVTLFMHMLLQRGAAVERVSLDSMATEDMLRVCS